MIDKIIIFYHDGEGSSLRWRSSILSQDFTEKSDELYEIEIQRLDFSQYSI